MKLIYQRPTELEIQEHDWRPIRVRFKAQGCIPGLWFEMTLAMAQRLPPPEQWPHVTGSLQVMFDAEVDPRFLMSEIVRCKLDPGFIGQCFERTPAFGEASVS